MGSESQNQTIKPTESTPELATIDSMQNSSNNYPVINTVSDAEFPEGFSSEPQS